MPFVRNMAAVARDAPSNFVKDAYTIDYRDSSMLILRIIVFTGLTNHILAWPFDYSR